MPNGHGVPLGCFLCIHCPQVGEPTSRMRFCQKHQMDVHIHLVCADFEYKNKDVKHSFPMAEGVLYAYIDVQGYGYPPPRMLVPLAKIADYKEWDDEQHRKGWAAARKQANKQFAWRKLKKGIFSWLSKWIGI